MGKGSCCGGGQSMGKSGGNKPPMQGRGHGRGHGDRMEAPPKGHKGGKGGATPRGH